MAIFYLNGRPVGEMPVERYPVKARRPAARPAPIEVKKPAPILEARPIEPNEHSPLSYSQFVEANRRVRVGIITPGLHIGGAELWILALLKYCDRERIEWFSVNSPRYGTFNPEMLARMRPYCDKITNDEFLLYRLNQECDIVLSWGCYGTRKYFEPKKRCHVCLVSHGSDEDYTRNVMTDAAYADALVGVSKAAILPFPKDQQSRAQVIYNMADLDRLHVTQSRAQIRKEWGIKPGQKVLGYLGRLSWEKNPKAVADAVAALPEDWVGVMVGDSWNRTGDEIVAHCRAVAGKRVKMVGWRMDVGNVLNAFDAGLSPSLMEGCALNIAEMWYAGVPVLATPVGQVLEVPHLVCGIPERPTGSQIATALLADRKAAKARRARVAAAREFVDANMTPAIFGRRWTELIVNLANSPRFPEAPAPAQVLPSRQFPRHD